MKKGYGGFRRHMKSKGVICFGSWMTPLRQEVVLQQKRIEQKMHPTDGGLPASDGLSTPATIGG
jgi:hypothetical protein